MNSTKNILAIYSSQDKDVLKYFLLHLQSIKNNFNIAVWSDDSVDDIEQWKSTNESRLPQTDVFPILLSNTFMNSEFVKSDEFKMLINRYKTDRAVIIPIILDECSWDVNFTFEHYNFNFNELQVFRKNENPISDGNPTDIVFTQISYYIMGLLNSLTKKNTIEKPVNVEEQKVSSSITEGQIAIDFFQESVSEHKVENEIKNKEEVGTKENVEEENITDDESAEVQEQILREKRLREKAEDQRRIEKEAQDKRAIVQEEIREREFIKARIAIGEKRHGQATKSLREVPWENGFGETVTTKRTPNRKNGLAKYNYRFNNGNTIEARSIIPERKRIIEEPRVQLVVEEKISAKIINPVRETRQEKEIEEIVVVEQTVTRKTDLAKYNHCFDNKTEIEVLKVETEKSGKKEPKTQIATERKKRLAVLKDFDATLWKNKLAERVASLKIVATESVLKCKRLLKINKEVKDKEEQNTQIAVERKKRPTVLNAIKATEWKNKLGIRVTSLKTVTKESLSKYRQLLDKKLDVKARRVVSEEKWDSEEPIPQMAVEEKKRTILLKKLREAQWDIKLNERTLALKGAVKKYFKILQDSLVKIIDAINQFYNKAKKNIGTYKNVKVRSGLLIVALVIFGILTYVFLGDSQKQSFTPLEVEKVEVVSDAIVKTENIEEIDAGATLKLGTGDIYNGGIIFTIDSSNKTGKIAYIEDKGPMTWKNAMNIHEQLGEGWRLPELDELRDLYKTIGPGTDNKGKFENELYWSATPFDEHQARLVKFSDGNASYHYNSSGTHRKFRVRAIKDFKR
ncbi:Lcl domain-containing protein [Zobellia barbeyronii]|uniref:DUF1566 domain-containing protein n=1 Tax=Zobellia barbeyronii TaxID=2748009 RepID=A0ABS5WIX9_9FLAO|nr:DUF1566 domain-containing protein [Zobellia barbeyronii]MBT2163124.1 DUF1566 domain-containing protein [Zobellia barbeyronii]